MIRAEEPSALRNPLGNAGRGMAGPIGAVLLLIVSGASIFVIGCADSQEQPAASEAASPGALVAQPDSARLERLWVARSRDLNGADFPLGPGDVLSISVPIEQLNDREVTVNSDDTIDLPLVGTLSVRGRNLQQLTDLLRQKLSRYMYDPPVAVEVKQYGSREVAIVGAVEKPGLYALMSHSETLMDMLSRAGGMTREAAPRVLFIPAGANPELMREASRLAEQSQPSIDEGVAATEGVHNQNGSEAEGRDGGSARAGAIRAVSADKPSVGVNQPQAELQLQKLDPIVLEMTDSRIEKYLDLPAQPGDVLIVPSAGEVSVGGWVQNPGAYKVTPGMTVLSAINAAGGAVFSWHARVLRTEVNGQRESIPVSINAVQKGEEKDVPIKAGDVVMVDRSMVGAVPYTVFQLFSRFGTGMYMPIP